MKEIKAGQFEAKVQDYGLTETKKGDPMAMVRFTYADGDGDNHFITWYGTFSSDKAKEISCEALAICGYTSSNLADLAKGGGSRVLDESRVVSITVAQEEWDGKTRMKVKYVNPPGGAGFRSQLTHVDAVKKFNGINIGAAMAEAKKKHSPPKREIVNHAPKFNTDEPIPF